MIHRFKDLKYSLAPVWVFIGSKIFMVGSTGKISAVISPSVTFALIAGGVSIVQRLGRLVEASRSIVGGSGEIRTHQNRRISLYKSTTYAASAFPNCHSRVTHETAV